MPRPEKNMYYYILRTFNNILVDQRYRSQYARLAKHLHSKQVISIKPLVDDINTWCNTCVSCYSKQIYPGIA